MLYRNSYGTYFLEISPPDNGLVFGIQGIEKNGELVVFRRIMTADRLESYQPVVSAAVEAEMRRLCE